MPYRGFSTRQSRIFGRIRHDKLLHYDFDGWDGFEILYGSELIYEHKPKITEDASIDGKPGKKTTRKIDKLDEYKEELKALEQYSQQVSLKR